MTSKDNPDTTTATRDRLTAREDGTTAEQENRLDLAARLELVEEENRRLRAEYARAKQSKYRHTAYGLFLVGALTALSGLLFPAGRDVLVTLGITGVFGGVLTLYLTPSRFVAADVGERVYAATAANYAALVDQLGLTDTWLYLPGQGRAAHLYIPQSPVYEVPTLDDGPLVTTDASRGLLFEATGALLFDAFEQAVNGPVATQPDQLATQLSDAVAEQFELADAISADLSSTDDRLTFRVTGSTLGDVDRVDHPLASFLAVGCATALETPVILEVDSTPERADWLVTLRWNVDTEADDSSTD